MGVISGVIGNPLDAMTYLLFLAFSCGLVLLFLTLALFIGSLSRNRWQALTISVTVWFFAVIGWPTLLLSVLGLMPYLWVKPLLVMLTLINPAELVRLFVVIKLEGRLDSWTRILSMGGVGATTKWQLDLHRDMPILDCLLCPGGICDLGEGAFSWIRWDSK